MLAEAQHSAIAPLEGGVYDYSCNGISVGAEYNFYVAANADGSGSFDDGLTGEFDFIGDVTGTIGSDGLATTQILWNEGASLNMYNVWLEVTIEGCSNEIRLEVNPQQNNRTAEFDLTASTECFNASDNSFELVLITANNSGQPLLEGDFPLEVAFSVNGQLDKQTVYYSNQIIQVNETLFTIDPTLNSDVSVEILLVKDKNNLPVKPGVNAIHTHTIFALPQIEFTELIRKKYNLYYEAITAYIPSCYSRL
jgi:hypothetical protein